MGNYPADELVGGRKPQLTPEQRLGVMLCLAAALHALVIGAGLPLPTYDAAPAAADLEIVLAPWPGWAEDGGDRLDDGAAAAGAAAPAAAANLAAALPATGAPTPASEAPVPAPAAEPPAPPPAEPVAPISASEPVAAPRPSAAALVTRGMELAGRSAQAQPGTGMKAEPRRRFVSATDRDPRYAAYMEAWRQKVERFGNLNYPQELKRRGLAGRLTLEVALNADGSIREIVVLRPSEHRLLNEAAVNIVRLAGDYAPFPEKIRAETDVLHITRTWQFLDNRIR